MMETPPPLPAYELNNPDTRKLWIVDVSKPPSHSPKVPSLQMGYVGPFDSYDAAEEYAQTLAKPFIGYVCELKPPQ